MKIKSLIFVLALAVFALSCNNSEKSKLDNSEETKKEEKKDKKDPFSEMHEVKLPFRLEAPTDENAAKILEKAGLEFLSYGNPNPKRAYFKAENGTLVGIFCDANIGGGIFINFSVLNEKAEKLGEEKTIEYLILYAGPNYHTASGGSEILIDQNRIFIETKGESTEPAPNTNLEDPELITKKLDRKQIFKITPNNLIEE